MKLFSTKSNVPIIITKTPKGITNITLTVSIPGEYRVEVYPICSNDIPSIFFATSYFRFIIIDDVCMISPCGTKYQYTSIPFSNASFVWTLGRIITVYEPSSGKTVNLGFSAPYRTSVCKAGVIKLAWNRFNLGNATITVTPTVTASGNTGTLTISSTGATITVLACSYLPPATILTEFTKQANTSNNPTTLETTDKSELQAEAETNEIQAENLQIAPNPFENYLRLNFENATIKQISIVNQLGQIVKSPVAQQEKNGILDIDTSDLRAGYYYCIVKTESKDYLFKVVKIE